MIKHWIGAGLLSACAIGAVGAAEMSATMQVLSGPGAGKDAGTVSITETKYGLVFTPSLAGLPPGLHGFHVHEKGNCGPGQQDGKTVAGQAAGGHYDPTGSKKHGPPWGDGHLGDLPGLVVDAKGAANYPVLAPRLKMADVKGRALMIHAGGDNYSDSPAPLGGGGGRLACGVIK